MSALIGFALQSELGHLVPPSGLCFGDVRKWRFKFDLASDGVPEKPFPHLGQTSTFDIEALEPDDVGEMEASDAAVGETVRVLTSSSWSVSIDVRVVRLVGEESTVKDPVLLEDSEVGDSRETSLGRMTARTLVSCQWFEAKSGPCSRSISPDMSIMSFKSAI